MQRARPSASLTPDDKLACKRITDAELGIYPMDDENSAIPESSDPAFREEPENTKRIPGRLFSWKRRRESAETSISPRIALPPLHTLVRVTRLLLDRKSYDRYVEPHIDEVRFECYQALKTHKPLLARWILIRGYWTITRPVREGVLKTIQTLIRGR